MSITLAQLKADKMAAFKNKESFRSKYIGLIIGDVETLLSREATEARTPELEIDLVKQKLGEFLKKNKETQEAIAKAFHEGVELPTDVFTHKMEESKSEEAILLSYMPAQLTSDQIEQIVTDNFTVVENKLRGQINLYFKANYAGQYNGGVLKSVIDKLITAQ